MKLRRFQFLPLLVLAFLVTSCDVIPNKVNSEIEITGIKGELKYLIDGEVVDCPSKIINETITYFVTTIYKYIFSVSPIYKGSKAINLTGDCVTFDDTLNNLDYENYGKFTYIEDIEGKPTYETYFFKVGTFEINFSVGDLKSNIKVISNV